MQEIGLVVVQARPGRGAPFDRNRLWVEVLGQEGNFYLSVSGVEEGRWLAAEINRFLLADDSPTPGS